MSWLLEAFSTICVGFKGMLQGVSEFYLHIVELLLFSELSHISGNLFSFPPLIEDRSENTLVKFSHLSKSRPAVEVVELLDVALSTGRLIFRLCGANEQIVLFRLLNFCGHWLNLG